MQDPDRLLQDALALPQVERQRLADKIYDSLDGDSQAAIDEAWVVECERRAKEMDEGKVAPGDWSKMLEDLRVRYGG